MWHADLPHLPCLLAKMWCISGIVIFCIIANIRQLPASSLSFQYQLDVCMIFQFKAEIFSYLPRGKRQGEAFAVDHPVIIGYPRHQFFGSYREIVFMYLPVPVLGIFVF